MRALRLRLRAYVRFDCAPRLHAQSRNGLQNGSILSEVEAGCYIFTFCVSVCCCRLQRPFLVPDVLERVFAREYVVGMSISWVESRGAPCDALAAAATTLTLIEQE